MFNFLYSRWERIQINISCRLSIALRSNMFPNVHAISDRINYYHAPSRSTTYSYRFTYTNHAPYFFYFFFSICSDDIFNSTIRQLPRFVVRTIQYCVIDRRVDRPLRMIIKPLKKNQSKYLEVSVCLSAVRRACVLAITFFPYLLSPGNFRFTRPFVRSVVQ